MKEDLIKRLEDIIYRANRAKGWMEKDNLGEAYEDMIDVESDIIKSLKIADQLLNEKEKDQ